MAVLAIDPGPIHSAMVLLDDERVVASFYAPNDSIATVLGAAVMEDNERPVAIEMIASYGMSVGAEVFETCVWIGRFMEIAGPHRVTRIKRGEVKMHLCNTTAAKDGNVRQALIDRFGGKDAAIGKKKTPGPLYGISGDKWAALAVAVTIADRIAAQARIAG